MGILRPLCERVRGRSGRRAARAARAPRAPAERRGGVLRPRGRCLSRLPVVARGHPHPAGAGPRRCQLGRGPLPRGARLSLGRAPSGWRHLGGAGPRCERPAAQHPVHGAEGEGRRVRPPARCARRTARCEPRRPRLRHRRVATWRPRDALPEPLGSLVASPRLPRARRPGAGSVEGDACSGHVAGRGLARAREGRRLLRRPHVRVGDARHRGGPHRRRCRAGHPALALGLPGLGAA